MYTNDYNKALERLNTVSELAKDLRNYEQSMYLLRHYSRMEAWNCLQSIIREYHEQIEICGLMEGVRLYNNVPLAYVSDQELQNQLMYIARRIPMYVLARESEKELAKRISEWLKYNEMKI